MSNDSQTELSFYCNWPMLMEQSSTSITSTGPPIQSIYTPAENVFIKLDCSGG